PRPWVVASHVPLGRGELEHGGGADRDPGRPPRRGGQGRLGQASADGRDRVRRGLVPHPRRHASEPDGDGTWWVPVRGLLEARVTAARPLPRCRRQARSGLLAVLYV